MRISFDLDDTLICYSKGAQYERRPAWWRRIATSGEPLRLGARDLMQRLSDQGLEIWIYTTSRRSPSTVERWLQSYGIQIERVVNQDIHEDHHRRFGPRDVPTKNPRAFGIDLHVDDSEGVRIEAERFGFPVVVVAPGDTDWAEKVLAAVEDISLLHG